jgi:hypothetical protein
VEAVVAIFGLIGLWGTLQHRRKLKPLNHG